MHFLTTCPNKLGRMWLEKNTNEICDFRLGLIMQETFKSRNVESLISKLLQLGWTELLCVCLCGEREKINMPDRMEMG